MGPADPVPRASARIAVTVVHSPRAGEVSRVALALAPDARVGDALAAAALAGLEGPAGGPLPEGWTLAVWGRRCGPDRTLRDGDRVELLRPLACDPKESRRLRYRRTPGRQGGIERGRAAVRAAPEAD